MKPANLILFIVISVVFLIDVTAQESNYSAVAIPEHLKANANAVVRLDQTLIHVESKKDMRIYNKHIVTVLNKKGNHTVAPVVYYDDSRKVTKLYAKIYDASGKEIKKIKEKDFSDRAKFDGVSLYEDTRYKIMNYVPVSYPYTIEFVSEVKTKNTAFINSWYPIRNYYVGVEKSEYQITYPPELGLRCKALNFEDYPIKDLSKDAILQYEATALNAIVPEAYGPSSSAIFPHLLVVLSKFHTDGYDGDISNWNDLGIWMNNEILTGRNSLPEETKQQIIHLVEGIEHPIEKAKKVVEYVQENTRYISVQIGIGGIQPASAAEVDALKYGDCKGLTNYTKSLLEVVGVPSYYTVVESGKSKVGFHEDFASLAQGDHAILCIPTENKNIFMDCTSQVQPFGFIGDFTDDRNVFIVKPDGGEIVKTTSYINEENYQNTKAAIAIAENGKISAEVNIITRGIQYDNRFHIDRLSPEDRKQHYKRYWSNINDLHLDNIEHSNDKDQVQFTQNVTLSFDNYTTQTSDKMLVTVNMFNNRYPVPTRYRNRKFPLEISRGFLDEDEYVIEIPSNYSIASIPNPIHINNEFGAYELSCKKTDDKHIVFKRKFALKKGIYNKEAYTVFRNFIKKVSKSDQSKLVLNKKT